MDMYIIYIYIYIFMFISIYLSTYLSIYLVCIYTYIGIYICTYICNPSFGNMFFLLGQLGLMFKIQPLIFFLNVDDFNPTKRFLGVFQLRKPMEIGIWYQGKWSCKQCFRFVLSGFLAFLLSVIPTGMGNDTTENFLGWQWRQGVTHGHQRSIARVYPCYKL